MQIRCQQHVNEKKLPSRKTTKQRIKVVRSNSIKIQEKDELI